MNNLSIYLGHGLRLNKQHLHTFLGYSDVVSLFFRYQQEHHYSNLYHLYPYNNNIKQLSLQQTPMRLPLQPSRNLQLEHQQQQQQQR